MYRWTPIALLACAAGCGGDDRVVLYCAQDRAFATELLADFERQNALRVDANFDTEATKSVALAESLLREKDRPRADVHWNNEIIATIRLAKAGVYRPYRSPAAADYPAWSRSPDGLWQAFAARARIIIVNTKLLRPEDYPRRIRDLTDGKWKGRIAMAKPMFGTTATQAACLWTVLGPEKTKAFYRGLKRNRVAVLSGNKQVAEAVGRGDIAAGMTDTDDALLEVEAGHPVALVFPDADGLGTLFIPNTVAVIRGSPRPERGERLVDYLLSQAVEKRLAEGGGHQIPLNPKVEANLPPQIKTPAQVKAMDVDFSKAAESWGAVQTFLRAEFAQ